MQVLIDWRVSFSPAISFTNTKRSFLSHRLPRGTFAPRILHEKKLTEENKAVRVSPTNRVKGALLKVTSFAFSALVCNTHTELADTGRHDAMMRGRKIVKMLSPTGSVVVVIRLKANEQHHQLSLSL
jgi:hypothetical protein